MPIGIQNDLTGRRFGRLSVIEYYDKVANSISRWRCLCECGTETVCRIGNLTSGDSTSCGCVHGVKISDPITHEQILALIKYNRSTGEFIARRNWRNVRKGFPIGCVDTHSGYQHITIGGTVYYGHVLAWFYVAGAWPTTYVDHKNTLRADNRWSNLRLATGTQQNANHPVRRDSKSGYKGVRQYRNKWQAYIIKNKKACTLGYAKTPEAAASLYDAAAKKLHGEFARTNF